MRRSAVVTSSLLLVLAGCGDGESEPAGQPVDTDSSPLASNSSAASEIIGEWKRSTTCQERVAALAAADLGQFAAEHAATEGWLPGVTRVEQLEDPTDPCEGAVPLEHSHFFTAEGVFGSRDAEGNQVDDGTYRLAGDDTIVIGDVTFKYEIRDDKLLFLDPLMPECASSGCSEAQWAVAVAYPGLPWERVS